MQILVVVANAQMRTFETCSGDGFRMASNWLRVRQSYPTVRCLWKVGLLAVQAPVWLPGPKSGKRTRSNILGPMVRGNQSGDVVCESGDGELGPGIEFSFLFDGDHHQGIYRQTAAWCIPQQSGATRLRPGARPAPGKTGGTVFPGTRLYRYPHPVSSVRCL